MNIPSTQSKSWWKIVTNSKHGDVFYIEAKSVSWSSDNVFADGLQIRIMGGIILDVQVVEGYLH